MLQRPTRHPDTLSEFNLNTCFDSLEFGIFMSRETHKICFDVVAHVMLVGTTSKKKDQHGGLSQHPTVQGGKKPKFMLRRVWHELSQWSQLRQGRSVACGIEHCPWLAGRPSSDPNFATRRGSYLQEMCLTRRHVACGQKQTDACRDPDIHVLKSNKDFVPDRMVPGFVHGSMTLFFRFCSE